MPELEGMLPRNQALGELQEPAGIVTRPLRGVFSDSEVTERDRREPLEDGAAEGRGAGPEEQGTLHRTGR